MFGTPFFRGRKSVRRAVALGVLLLALGALIAACTQVTSTPETQTRTVGDTATIYSTVADVGTPGPGTPTDPGTPIPDAEILYFVLDEQGAIVTSGSGTTDVNGQTSFSYTNWFPGTHTVKSCTWDPYTASELGITIDDLQHLDSSQVSAAAVELDQVCDTSTVVWELPKTTPGTSVSTKSNFNDGITLASVGIANRSGATSGNLTYQGNGIGFTSVNITAVNVTGKDAIVYGTGTLRTGETVQFLLDTHDGGTGRNMDTYRLRLSTGFDSGLVTTSQGAIPAR